MRLHGDSSATPCGMHVNAWRIFAVTDLNSANAIPRSLLAICIHPLSTVNSFSRFASSSHIVLCSPSKSNPNSVFLVLYSPSLCFSFFNKIGSSSSSASAGNTSWIPVMTAVAVWSSCCRVTGITILMKSSTYTSTMYKKPVSSSPIAGNSAIVSLVITCLMNLCAGREDTCVSMYSSMMSLAVSDAAQNKGGDSTHPICSDVGMTNVVGHPGGCGRTYAKLYSCPSSPPIRQNPSLMSHFAINIFASSSVSANA